MADDRRTVNLSVGSKVRAVSGPHEGRSGQIIHIGYPKISFEDPEPYAIVKFVSDVDPQTGQERYDEFATPVRRLNPS
jgi:hypothetical protein